MTMIDKLVLEALQKRTTDAVAASINKNLKVKYVGLTHKPDSKTPWLEVVHIPNNIENEFWNTGKTYRGLYRLLLHWPIDGKGIYPAMELIASIGALFDKGTALANGEAIVRIVEHPDMPTILEMESENICVLAVRYNCFKV